MSRRWEKPRHHEIPYLFGQPQPAARPPDLVPAQRASATSSAAAESKRHAAPAEARRIWLMIAAQHTAGMTCDDVEIATGGLHQTISARICYLRDRGCIADSGKRRRTRTGRKAIVWTATNRAP